MNMVNERNFRIAWNLMWHYKHILDEGIGDSELLVADPPEPLPGSGSAGRDQV